MLEIVAAGIFALIMMACVFAYDAWREHGPSAGIERSPQLRD